MLHEFFAFPLHTKVHWTYTAVYLMCNSIMFEKKNSVHSLVKSILLLENITHHLSLLQVVGVTSKITVTIIDKTIIKFEISRELWKCHRDTNEQRLLEKWHQKTCLTQGYHKPLMYKKCNIGKAQ